MLLSRAWDKLVVSFLLGVARHGARTIGPVEKPSVEGGHVKNNGRTCVEVMTKDPLACQPADTAARAAQVMKALDVGPIPVERHPLTVKIEEVMTRDLVTCSADDEVDKAMRLMAEHQLRRIPVIDNEGAIIGIIAQADVATKATAAEQTGKVVEEISRPRDTRSRSAVV